MTEEGPFYVERRDSVGAVVRDRRCPDYFRFYDSLGRATVAASLLNDIYCETPKEDTMKADYVGRTMRVWKRDPSDRKFCPTNFEAFDEETSSEGARRVLNSYLAAMGLNRGKFLVTTERRIWQFEVTPPAPAAPTVTLV